ncbi:MAG: F0F1 ATP synthase subunit delta [Betaproteobacteria bacterium]|nr:F0F1 ATP synthase subunit delta [Betaproteobacteria bacterium]
MAEIATIARPYAEAAFRLAEESGATSSWSSALSRLAAVAQSADVEQLVGNPRVTSAQLTELLVGLSGESDASLRNFVGALVENKRVPALPSVHEQFEVLKNEREGTIDATIESALPMDDQQLATLVADLERRFKRRIRPQVTINAELIGGACVRVGDEVIDGSVRSKLAAMSVALKN